LIRQWILLKQLSSRHYGVTVREMAQEFGVNEKTIRRDLNIFRDAGFPLVEKTGEYGKKTWKLELDGKPPELSFPFDEALALYLGRRFMEPLAGTPMWEAARRAFKKIRACLPQSALDYLEKMGGQLHQTSVGASDYSQKSAIIEQLMIGIEDRRATLIAYQSMRATEPVTYDVYPYGLSYHRGSLYLIAHAPDHGEVRHYKVDRISDAEAGEFPFQRPADFDLEEHLSNSFGIFQGRGDARVRVRFSSSVARYVSESRWHASQQLTRQKDGALVAEFQLSDTEEIKHWILSFGKEAQVLAPAALRDELAVELEALLALYRTDSEVEQKSPQARRPSGGSV
jgi:proteasome accessory factor B